MRIRRFGMVLAASGAAAVMSLPASPSLSSGSGQGGGVVTEEFVCYRSAGDHIMLGTGKVITTPSGQTHVVCTGQQFQSG